MCMENELRKKKCVQLEIILFFIRPTFKSQFFPLFILFALATAQNELVNE